MGRITGREPQHWHRTDTDKARSSWAHNMTDPRTIEGLPPNIWDADQRAYVRHLLEHEGEQIERSPDDDGYVQLLFETIEIHRKIIDSAEALIVTLRMQSTDKKSEATAER